jgi:hypothetical protein
MGENIRPQLAEDIGLAGRRDDGEISPRERLGEIKRYQLIDDIGESMAYDNNRAYNLAEE